MTNYTSKQNKLKNENKSGGRWFCICLFWLAIWFFGAMAVNNSLLLPTPLDTVKAFLVLCTLKKFYLNIGWTMIRCLLAILLSFLLGLIAAGISHKSQLAKNILSLPVGFFKAVPVMAVIIYVILIIKSDWVAVIVCFFMCFPIVYTNMLTGLDSMSEEYLEVGYICSFDWRQRIRYIYLPALLPQIKASTSLIAGLSWKAVVAAEVLSIPKYSLGYEMMNSKYYLDSPQLFAYIGTIVVLSLSFEKIIKKTMASIEWKDYTGTKIKPGKAPKNLLQNQRIDSPTVSLNHVYKAFDGNPVLDDINITFEKNKITALSGPSGKGKTTIARLICGFILPDKGFVSVEGDTSCKPAILFQEDRLFPWLNIYDNMYIALINSGLSFREADKIIAQMLESLELQEARHMLPKELSGGMKSRCALGRTLLLDSNLVILDEPFKGLNDEMKKRIVDRIWDKYMKNKTVIIISHNIEDITSLSDTQVKI